MNCYMVEFDKIYLAWRKGLGHGRHIVGLLEKKPDEKYLFNYLSEAEKLKKEEGFIPYTEFQDLQKQYNGNVVDIFGQRLIKIDRPDISNLFNFWEVDLDQAHDKFYLLGKTQGLVPTDNFEFLADYKMQSNLHFLTDIAGLSTSDLPRGTVEIGDILRFEKEPDNEVDPTAIKIFKGQVFLGYIKKIHNRIFHEKDADKLKLAVKALEQNGNIKRIFVKISLG